MAAAIRQSSRRSSGLWGETNKAMNAATPAQLRLETEDKGFEPWVGEPAAHGQRMHTTIVPASCPRGLRGASHGAPHAPSRQAMADPSQLPNATKRRRD